MTFSSEELPRLSSRSKRDEAKERIRELIQRGKLSGNGYLPSVRKTAELIGLNRDAVWRAYGDLESEGFLRATDNKRFEIHPAIRNSQLRTLDVRLIAAGEDTIRFAGLQRFHKAIVDNGERYGLRTHLKCVVDARDIEPTWLEGMDALIIGGYLENAQDLDPLLSFLPSIGVISHRAPGFNICIDTDNQLAGSLAADRFIETGASRPCIVSYENMDTRHILRKLGFQTRWVECGKPIESITEHWITARNTYERVVELEGIARGLYEHDCVYCLDKASAIDLLSILEHRKLRVPEDLKVISIDGTFDGLKTKPPLTYVKQRFEEMASIAAEKIRLLCAKGSENGSAEAVQTVVAPRLVIRESA